MDRRERGQTLVVALIIMGILLLVGFAFLGIVTRNIRTSARLQERSAANDLAEAGVRYAHAQLLHSELGADWRGTPTSLTPTASNTNMTLDPDAYYLRPGTGLSFPNSPGVVDLGGPDGLGPYIRVNYQDGRALVRVRYAPSDANIFSVSPTGAIRNPGSVRNYTIIESVGREGRINVNDPTTLGKLGGVQYRGFGSTAQLDNAIRQMQTIESQLPSSRKLRAFASIGIIEDARYISDKERSSRPADIGVPSDTGAIFGGSDVGTQLPLFVGSAAKLINPADGSTTAQAMPGFGSIYSNAPLRFYGNSVVNLNQMFNESITSADVIRPADNNASLTIRRTYLNNGVFASTNTSLTSGQIDSRSSGFSTLSGMLRDGIATTDAQGFPRGAGYKTPPSIETTDPDTGELRYVKMTRESGVVLKHVENGQTVAQNSGAYGYGSGVYVGNTWDRQISTDETGRADVGSSQSLMNDWLNPNNGGSNSGWKGPFYVPPGAFVQLTSDGFYITLDGNDQQKYWRGPNGMLPTNSSGQTVQTSKIRYRIGNVTVNGRSVPYIVNSFTSGANIDAKTPTFSAGRPFNGVLCFEGNVRVRGVIPTDVQMTLVSYGTIYIEGSITKGVLENNVTDPSGTSIGRRISRQSRSTLMLAAKDYVAVNTSMFVGPSSDTQLETVGDSSSKNFSAVGISAANNQSLRFDSEFPLDPASGATPDVWLPYVSQYREYGNTSTPIPTRLVVAHSKSGNTAPTSFIGWNINPDYADTATSTPSTYYFPRTSTDPTVQRPLAIFESNATANYDIAGGPTYFPMYGLGGETYQQYPNFETVAFPVVNPATLSSTELSTGTLVSTGPEGGFALFSQGSTYDTDPRRNDTMNTIEFRPQSLAGEPSGDYMLARAALVPNDVRIEASVYAEDGSFFVIPGPWFNPNPNDTRAEYEARITAFGAGAQARARADQERLERYGSTPIMPFFGEPVDVRVQVIGAVSENMPPPMSQQSEWIRKWYWIPRQLSAMHDYTSDRDIQIPESHVTPLSGGTPSSFVPNFTVSYDTVLATARANGYVNNNNPYDTSSPVIRSDEYGRALPPMPRLPVSPTLAYFGEVK